VGGKGLEGKGVGKVGDFVKKGKTPVELLTALKERREVS